MRNADIPVTVTLVLPEAEFAKLVEGKAKAQNLFMSGKLKIQGNMMKGESTLNSESEMLSV